MNYIESIFSTIEYIEDHLSDELSIHMLAQVSGYSKYHFLRMFKAVIGITPAEYLRKRRLTEIVVTMLCSERYISEIAFEYGFNSKENFDRAFKKEHNVAPSKVRAVSNSLKLYHKFNAQTEDFYLIPKVVTLDGVDLTVYQSDSEYPPHFWNQYNCEKRSGILSGGNDGCMDYGVSCMGERLQYYIGIRTEEANGDTSNTISLHIPVGTYAVFLTPKGSQADFINNIHKTWNYINTQWGPESGYARVIGPEFETYIESSRTFQEQIYIPIREVISMEKNISVTWDGVMDQTGYLHSFAKSLMAVVKSSKYVDLSEDVIAASGFAFRMWMAKDLCPSAMSIWEFRKQKDWARNAGLECSYVERLWGEDSIEEERRSQALELIRNAIDHDTGVVAWDVSGSEWGVITGYDDQTQAYQVLKISGETEEIAYTSLGKLEIPILSVLVIDEGRQRNSEEIVRDTMALAYQHLSGQEWCDNVQGIQVYEALIQYLQIQDTKAASWSLEYYLGTYAALKYYAWKFFEKYKQEELSSLYIVIYENWLRAFEIKKSRDSLSKEEVNRIIECLARAKKAETMAMEIMYKCEKNF